MKITIGIDIGQETLKVCVVSKTAKFRQITVLRCLRIKGLSDDEIARHLMGLLLEIKVKNAEYVLIVPSEIVITKTIEVPSTEPREIKEIVNLQAERHTPHSRQEVIVDYLTLGTVKQSYTRVLLLIVTANAVKQKMNILEKAKININRLILGQEAIAIFAQRFLRVEPLTATALVNIDDAISDFSVIRQGKVLFMRSIPIGTVAFCLDSQKAMLRFREEIKRSLDVYQTENPEQNPTLILLINGEQQLCQQIEDLLFETTQIPVRNTQYLGVVPNIVKNDELSCGCSYLTVIAASLLSSDCRTNLLPEEIRLRRLVAQRMHHLMTTAVVVFAIVFFILLSMMVSIYFKQQYLEQLNIRYAQRREKAKALEEILRKNRLARSYLSQRGLSTAVLAELHTVTPINIELNYIRFEQEGRMVLRGTAESMTAAFAYADTLSKSKFFSEVKTKYATKRQEGKREVADFEINCNVKRHKL